VGASTRQDKGRSSCCWEALGNKGGGGGGGGVCCHFRENSLYKLLRGFFISLGGGQGGSLRGEKGEKKELLQLEKQTSSEKKGYNLGKKTFVKHNLTFQKKEKLGQRRRGLSSGEGKKAMAVYKGKISTYWRERPREGGGKSVHVTRRRLRREQSSYSKWPRRWSLHVKKQGGRGRERERRKKYKVPGSENP